jgi:hypothetical protein
MEHTNTNSGLSHTDTHNSINETLPAGDTMASSSLPSNEKQAIAKSVNGRIRFPFKLHRLGRQPDNPHDGADKLHGSDRDSQKRSALSIFSRVKAKPSHINKTSIGEKKLDEIIQDLNDHPVEEEAFEEQKIPVTGCPKWMLVSCRSFFLHVNNRQVKSITPAVFRLYRIVMKISLTYVSISIISQISDSPIRVLEISQKQHHFSIKQINSFPCVEYLC